MLAHTVFVAGSSGERRVDLARPLGIFEIRGRFTREGNLPMVTLSRDGVARVSYPHLIEKAFFWE